MKRSRPAEKESSHHPIPLAILLLPIQVLTGCMTPNHFSQFYRDYAGSAITNMPAWSGQTVVHSTSDPLPDIKALLRKNYMPIGQSSFRSAGQATEQMIRSQARKVGADIVLYKVDYLGSQQSTMPILQYNPGQTYTTTSSGTVNANVYGSGGYAYGTGNYYATSTTTTPGTPNSQPKQNPVV